MALGERFGSVFSLLALPALVSACALFLMIGCGTPVSQTREQQRAPNVLGKVTIFCVEEYRRHRS